jgi:hypothetical protein
VVVGRGTVVGETHVPEARDGGAAGGKGVQMGRGGGRGRCAEKGTVRA